MPNDDIDLIFSALADPTRRLVVEQLLQDGPAPVKELAAPHAMALPSFLQHLEVLEDRRIVRSEKVGRSRMCSLAPDALKPLELWVQRHRQSWESRLDRLDRIAQAREADFTDDGDPT